MSVIIQPNQVFTIQFGLLVTKPAAAIPQTATANLYTVAGGNVLVTSILGQVTTVIGGTATTLAIGLAPTTGTAQTGGIATAVAITSKEVGTWVSAQASAGGGGALVVGGSTGTAGGAPFLPAAFVAPVGTITITTSASTTGAMKWYLSYIPLDVGASVS